jgi:ankyrin repeat protein
LEAVKLLLDLGADIEARSWPYDWGVDKRWDGEKWVLDEKKEFEDRPCGGTALHFAAEFGWIEVMRLLLDRGARISAVNEYGWTPLHLAVLENRFEAAEFLVSRGADIEAPDGNQLPPRHYLFRYYGNRIYFEDNGYLRWFTLLRPRSPVP